MARLLTIPLVLSVVPLSLLGQLNSNCTVSILNKTVPVQPDGSWIAHNVPANFGPIRARAVCSGTGSNAFGTSDIFSVTPGAAVNLPDLRLGEAVRIPIAVTVSAPTTKLVGPGTRVQLAVLAMFASGESTDVAAASTGTTYRISNTAIADISDNGMVSTVASGTVIVQATNEGRSGSISIQVIGSGDSDGDGIPDDWEIAHGLNPNDPTDAMEDPDHDGLTNLQEYQQGTDPHNPDTDGDGLKDGDEVNKYHTNPLLADTDGDGIPDGVEIATGTDPLDPKSYNLAKALKGITVTPPSLTLTVSSINPNVSAQLKVTGSLIDNKTTIDLTSTSRGTQYTSSNLTICNFGSPDGTVFAGANGACTVTVSVGGFSVQVPVTVSAFSPSVSSTLAVPGALRVDVNGNTAFVAAGGNGVDIVDVTDRTKPNIVQTFKTFAPAQAVRSSGNFAYVAMGAAGLGIYDVSNPLSVKQIAIQPLPGVAQDIAIRSGYAYVADGPNGMVIVNVSNPAAPSITATVSAGSGKSVIGVDEDPVRKVAAMALGGDGLALVDVTNPAAPVLKGTLPGGSVNKVALRGTTAYLADVSRSFTAVDITNLSAPVLASSTPRQFGGLLYDVALAGNYAFGADVFFVNGVPVIDISTPLAPAPRAIINFPGDATGTGVAADFAWVYMVADNGVLHIGQYQQVSDPFGIPPTTMITSPAPGTQLIARSRVTIGVQATDDVAVASVQVLVNGQVVGTTTAFPYSVDVTVPKGVTSVTIGAQAVDYGGNVGKAPDMVYPVIIGPTMTVTGSGVDRSGNVMAGAQLNILNEFTTTAGADSRFTITGVPAAIGPFRVYGQITYKGVVIRGRSQLLSPAPNGTVDAGQLIYFPSTAWDGLPDDWKSQYSCLSLTAQEDANDPDGDGLTNYQEYVLGTNPCIPNLEPGRTEVFTAVHSVQNGAGAGSLRAGLNETVTAVYAIANGGSIPSLPAGLNETVSATYAVMNQGSNPTLPAGLNETVSAVYAIQNMQGSPSLPSGLNETVSAVYALANGPIGGNSLPSGLNEAVSGILSVANGQTPITLGPGLSETVSMIYSVLSGSPSSMSPHTITASPENTDTSAGRFSLTVAGVNPEQMVEGQTVVLALGKLAPEVRSVEYVADGASLGSVADAPFELALTLPARVPHIQIRAIAKDGDGQALGFAVRELDITRAATLSLPGRLVDESGNPARGVPVHAFYHGLQAEFFDYQVPLVAIPDLVGKTPGRSGPVTALNYLNPERVFGMDPMDSGMLPDFAARFHGFVEIREAGRHVFFVRSQEGARLIVNGKQILEVTGSAGSPRELSGEIDLQPGLIPIEVLYFAAAGGEELNLSWATPGAGRKPVPQSVLWADSDRTVTTADDGSFVFENLSGSVGTYELVASRNGSRGRASATVPAAPGVETRLQLIKEK